MRVKELRDLLAEYPGDAEVFLINERRPLDSGAGTLMDVRVFWSTEQDTGEGRVCICPMIKAEEIPRD